MGTPQGLTAVETGVFLKRLLPILYLLFQTGGFSSAITATFSILLGGQGQTGGRLLVGEHAYRAEEDEVQID